MPDQRPALAMGVQWGLLLMLSSVLVGAMELIRLPAALLLGSMAAAIVLTLMGGSVRVSEGCFMAAQGLIGCMIARSLNPSLLKATCQNWQIFVVMIFAVIAASSALGWMLARWRVLPGTTAVWGSSPGAATAMTVMAESYGADVRLVAMMQYLRVVLVVAVASSVAKIWVSASGAPVPAVNWFPALHWGPFCETLGLAAAGILAAWKWRIQAGALLIPLVVGGVLQGTGAMTITLPPWLLAASYIMVGWSIGLRFSRPILAHCARALPYLVLSILGLILICGSFAFMLNRATGIDPLTAYLATSPGGADSVAIIAASAKVDLPFVMAMQTMRFLAVLLLGPSIARFVAERIPKNA